MFVTFVMICNACDIYVVIWGPFYVKNKKKDLFGHFAVCQAHGKVTIWPALNTKFAVCLDRAHGELTIVRRVPKPGAHGEPTYFAVCQSQGAHGEPKYFAVCQSQGHTAKWEISPCA